MGGRTNLKASLVILVLLAGTAWAGWPQQCKITASDEDANDRFGGFVSVSGNYAVVGAHWDDDKGDNSGSAYIFKKSDTPGDPNWYEQVKLIASDGNTWDGFGFSVSVSGDYAIVGAFGDDSGKGSAYIFKKSDTPGDPNWYQQDKLIASDGAAYDEFGFSVSVSGDYAIVGAFGDDSGGVSSGSAYIFKKSDTPGDPNWYEQVKLTASDEDANDRFGRSVSVSGDYAIVGAYWDDDKGDNSGSAYIFKKSDTPGDPNWYQQDKLIASDGAAYDQFGKSVSVSGDYAVVGAPYDDDKGNFSGSAYMFKKSDTPSDPNWYEQVKLTASDGAENDLFGESVSVSGDYAIVGASTYEGKGSVYIFKKSDTPGDPNWYEQDKLTASDGADYDWFGFSVSVSGDYAVVGAVGDDGKGTYSGSAYIFGLDGDDDGIANGIDNCPNDANPLQSDVDGDRAGDICDDCPAKSNNECITGGSAAAEIDRESGGTLATPDGNLTINFDPCDVNEDTTISVTQIVTPDRKADLVVGHNKGLGVALAEYDLKPDELVFDSNVTVTVKFDVTGLTPDESGRLGLYLWDGKQFVILTKDCPVIEDPCGVFTKTCTVEMGHFSTIAMVREVMILYVKADAAGAYDGSSWTDAYKYLQDALADSSLLPDDEIRVAKGTYYPDTNTADPCGTGDREATFGLINGVSIYGGFAGTEDPCVFGLAYRDFVTNETILSGDINTPGDANDNSYHVVTGSGTEPNAVLDGFTITGGNANGAWASAQSFGGGMYNDQGSPTIAYCKFSGNSADYASGAVHNYNNSNPRIYHCTFSGNTGTYSGAMQNRGASAPTLTNCIFYGNTASDSGAISNHINSSPTLFGCVFSGNSATTGDGGAIRNTSNSNPDIINCTFSGNEATSGNGGGIFNDGSSPTLSNSIVWGNTASDGNEIALLNFSTIDVNYCDIKDGNDGIYKEDSNCTVNWGSANIDADPLFADADLRLSAGSPCIDDGNNAAVPADTNDIDNDGNTTESIPWDLDGRPRFADGDCNTTDIVDMGAFEFTYAYIGDFAGGCDVDLTDFSILADYWLTDELLVDIAPTPAGDGIIDERDLAIFVDNWLEGI